MMTSMMTGHLLHDFQNLNFPRGEIILKMGFALYFRQAEIANRNVQRTDTGSHDRSDLCPTSIICITKALSNILHGPQSTLSSHIMSCLLHCPVILTQMFTISPICFEDAHKDEYLTHHQCRSSLLLFCPCPL